MTEHLTPHAAPQHLHAKTELGTVHLDVSDIQRSIAFWTRYVGLTEIARHEDHVDLGINGRAMISLYPEATGPVVPRHTGLYHVAIHLPSKRELARVVARLAALGWPQSPTDHTETMATYFSDPDGIGIEITYETPERGHLVRSHDSFEAVMRDGTVRRATEALNVNDLMQALGPDDDLAAPMPPGTRIGHVHLHVNDISAAREYYRDVIGFGDMRAFERVGMSDFSLATSYVPHALAVNTWNGRTASPRPSGTAGLRYWELLVPSTEDVDAIEHRLVKAGASVRRDGDALETSDPSGNLLHVVVGG